MLFNFQSTPIDLKLGGWGQVFGHSEKQDQGSEYFGCRTETIGSSAGFDSCFGNFIVGMSLGKSKTKVDFADGISKNHVDTYYLGVYGSFTRKKLYLDSSFTLGWNKYNAERKIQVGGIDRVAYGDFHGDEWAADIGGGYFMQLGGIRMNRLFNVGDIKIIPEFRAKWLYELENSPIKTKARLMGAPAQTGLFSSLTAEKAENSAMFGFSIGTKFVKKITCDLNYDCELRDHYYAHRLTIGMLIEF